MNPITSIRIKVGGTEVDLPIAEAKALRDALNELLGGAPVIREIIHERDSHYPWVPPITIPSTGIPWNEPLKPYCLTNGRTAA